MEMIPSPPPAPMKGKRTAGRKKEANFKTPTTPNVPLQQMQFKTRLTMEMIPTPPAAPKQKKRNAGRKTQPRTKPVPKRKKQGPIKPLPPRPDEEEYGDRVSRKKAKNVTRVCLQNINRLPLEARPNTETALGVPFNKNHQFCQAVKDKGADIFLFSEHGLNFHKLPAEDQWNERALHQLPPGHIALLEANTSEEPAAQGKQPWGGTGLIAMPEMKPRTIEQGTDPSGLARWTWIRLQGKHGKTSRIVSAYRPVPHRKNSTNPTSGQTVYEQHVRHFRKNKTDREPRQAFLEDLKKEIQEWKAVGDEIVVGIDANDDIRGGDVSQMFSSENMTEAILQRHHQYSPPATYNRNHRRKPIDGIFTTSGLVVTRAGYDAFGEGCPSDHRLLFIDITTKSLFGYDKPPLYHSQAKRFQSHDPRKRRKYNKITKELYDKDLIWHRVYALEEKTKNDEDPQEIQEEYNLLHKDMTAIRMTAEKKTRKFKVGGVPWSPTIQKLMDKIQLWLAVRKLHRNTKTSKQMISRLMRKCQEPTAMEVTAKQAKTSLKQAKQELRTAKKHAPAWRRSHLNSLAQAKADFNKTTREIEKKSMILIEKQRQQHRRINRVTKGPSGGAATKLYYNERGQQKEAVEQSDMEKACIQEGLQRFTQCQNTPFLQEPLLSKIGIIPDAPTTTQILYGLMEIPPGTEPHAVKLLQALRLPPSATDQDYFLPTQISPQEHKAQWKKKKEQTVSEPSGPSFTHYKAASFDPALNKVDSIMRSIPRAVGFSPEAWQAITDFQILKQAGVFEIEKMRIIQLMHSEFNSNNQFDGGGMMKNAEKHKNMAKEQGGSRKNHQSNKEVLGKCLFCDILRQKVLAGAIISNDAKACYDRIALPVAFLAMARQGLAYTVLVSIFETLMNAAHFIQTGYGRSKQSYGGTKHNAFSLAIQGIGQGNGAGPAIWAVISTVLVSLMLAEGCGASFLMALSLSTFTFLGFLFVDDTDLLMTTRSSDSSATGLVAVVQQHLDLWDGFLRATGGALVPKKSFWYLIDFQWIGNRWQYKTEQDLPGEVQIVTTDGNSKVPLTRVPVTEGKETLGIFLAPDGSTTEFQTQLAKKIDIFVTSMSGSNLNKNDAWLALTTRCMKQLEYPMLASTLSHKEWKSLMSPLLQTMLPKSGISRMFPRAVLYGPKDFQGQGLKDPYYHQEILKIQACTDEVNTTSYIGDFIQSSTEQLQLELGYIDNFSTAPYKQTQAATTDCWLKSLWQFADANELTFETDFPTIALLRENDEPLMPTFVKHKFFGATLKRLREVCTQLQVCSTADISTADGRHIRTGIIKGEPTQATFRQALGWPRKPPQLTPQHWKDWENALRICLSTRQEKELDTPLKRWLQDPVAHWQWFYDPSSRWLLQKVGRVWRVFKSRSRGNPIGKIYQRTQQFTIPTQDSLQLATVELGDTPNQLRVTSTANPEQRPRPPPPEHHTLYNRCQHLALCDQWAVRNLRLGDDGLSLVDSILSHTAVAVSDGSYEDSLDAGSSAFILTTSVEQLPIDMPDKFGNLSTTPMAPNDTSIRGANITPGSPEDVSPFRAELSGVVGILVLLQELCTHYALTHGMITIGLDGQSAKDQAAGHWTLKAKQPSFDMLQDIRGRVKALPITCKFKWIKGHQDDHAKILTNWERLNVYVDQEAKDFRNSQGNPTHLSPRFRYERWATFHRGEKLARIHVQKAYAMLYPRTIPYWQKRHGLSDFDVDLNIHWEAMRRAMNRLHHGKLRWLCKFATGHCATGRMLLRRDHQNHSLCPRCGEEDETTLHVLTCQQTEAVEYWQAQITNLKKWMAKNHTDPYIQALLVSMLTNWHITGTFQPTGYFPPKYRLASQHQSSMGGFNFLLGRIASSLVQLQHKYLQSRGRRTTGTTWASILIHHILEIPWNMWTHRNQARHDPTGIIMTKTKDDIMVQVEVLLGTEMGDLLQQDQYLLSQTAPQIRSRSCPQIHQWVDSVNLALSAKMRADHRATLQTPEFQATRLEARQRMAQHRTATTQQRREREVIDLDFELDDNGEDLSKPLGSRQPRPRRTSQHPTSPAHTAIVTPTQANTTRQSSYIMTQWLASG